MIKHLDIRVVDGELWLDEDGRKVRLHDGARLEINYGDRWQLSCEVIRIPQEDEWADTVEEREE